MTDSESIVFAEKFINCKHVQCEKVKNDCDICEYDFEKIGRISDFVKTAIKALEKQIPKKPRFYAHNYYCSVCDSIVGNNEFEWKRFKYCDRCGQKLDWSDEDE